MNKQRFSAEQIIGVIRKLVCFIPLHEGEHQVRIGTTASSVVKVQAWKNSCASPGFFWRAIPSAKLSSRSEPRLVLAAADLLSLIDA